MMLCQLCQCDIHVLAKVEGAVALARYAPRMCREGLSVHGDAKEYKKNVGRILAKLRVRRQAGVRKWGETNVDRGGRRMPSYLYMLPE